MAEEDIQIKEITISNFKSIKDTITIYGIQESNNLIGLFNTLKKDIGAAIIFALGASPNEIQLTKYKDVHHAPADSFVELVVKAGFIHHKLKRQINGNDNEQLFINRVRVTSGDYKSFLEDLNFNLNKQIHFYDAVNRKMFWNLLTYEQDELLATLTNKTKEVKDFHKLETNKKNAKSSLKPKELRYRFDNEELKKLKSVLPLGDWDPHYLRYVILRLKREEAERIRKKDELGAVEAELNQIRANNEALTERNTQGKETIRDFNRRNGEVLESLAAAEFQRFQTHGILALQNHILFSEDTIRFNKMFILDKQSLLHDLERFKNAAESHIAFMNSANGQSSNMISEDALLKLYPLYHSQDELEMDKIELDLIEKEEELNNIDDKKVLSEYFEAVLPEQSLPPMEETIGNMCLELQNSLKGVFEVNSIMHPEYELELEIIKRSIPEGLGFMLCSVFEPIDEQHRNLINNILFDYKYTIVFYDRNHQFMKKMIEKNPKVFQNVRYLFLPNLPKLIYTRMHRNHWLHLCRYIGDDRAYERLYDYMQREVNIIYVNTHAEVQDAFQNHSRQYVASLDGQLIYKRNMGVDVLYYCKPGEKHKEMHFPDATQRLIDAYKKFGQWMSSIFDPENLPRLPEPNIVDANVLRAEVNQLKQRFAQRKQLQANQMETLRQKMDEPYPVADTPNFDNAKVAEQTRLNGINQQIAKLHNEVAELQLQNQNLQADINGMKRLLQFKTAIKTLKKEISILNETIKKNEEEVEKNKKRFSELTVSQEKLQRDIKNLKYRTMTTILRANMEENINWTTWPPNCNTTPITLFQDFVNGIYVDPMVISYEIEDEDDEDEGVPLIYYGRKEWERDEREKRTMLNEQRDDIKALKDRILSNSQSRDARLQILHTDFISFNARITRSMNNMRARLETLRPELTPNVKYRFRFEFERYTNTSNMVIAVVEDKKTVENLSLTERVCLHWLLFAAFHAQSHAPFMFIDLTDVNDEQVIQLIDPIINMISEKSQIFINSSHLNHIHLAKLQIGVNKTVPDRLQNYAIQIITHDGERHVHPENGSDRPSPNQRPQNGYKYPQKYARSPVVSIQDSTDETQLVEIDVESIDGDSNQGLGIDQQDNENEVDVNAQRQIDVDQPGSSNQRQERDEGQSTETTSQQLPTDLKSIPEEEICETFTQYRRYLSDLYNQFIYVFDRQMGQESILPDAHILITNRQLMAMLRKAKSELVKDDHEGGLRVLNDVIIPEWVFAVFCKKYKLNLQQAIEAITRIELSQRKRQ